MSPSTSATFRARQRQQTHYVPAVHPDLATPSKVSKHPDHHQSDQHSNVRSGPELDSPTSTEELLTPFSDPWSSPNSPYHPQNPLHPDYTGDDDHGSSSHRYPALVHPSPKRWINIPLDLDLDPDLDLDICLDQEKRSHLSNSKDSASRIGMDYPSSSMESSWRSEDKGKDRALSSQEKGTDVIWDIQHQLDTMPSGSSGEFSYPVNSNSLYSSFPRQNQTGQGSSSSGLGRYRHGQDPTSRSGGRSGEGAAGAGGMDKRLERWFLERGGNGPLPTAVWASVMDSSKGRDKVLKTIQYTLKTYLYVLSLIAGVRPLPKWFKSNSKRMRITVSSLSLTRKCLLLLNPLHPLTHLLSPEPTSATTLIRHLIDLTGAISDDLYCFSLLGLVSRRTGKVAERWANRFWLLNTLIGLWKIQLQVLPRLRRALPPSTTLPFDDHPVERDDKLVRELSVAEWTNRKLLADLAFVSYDVFHLSWFKEPIQCLTGLISGAISASQLYDQHWDASLGKG